MFHDHSRSQWSLPWLWSLVFCFMPYMSAISQSWADPATPPKTQTSPSSQPANSASLTKKDVWYQVRRAMIDKQYQKAIDLLQHAKFSATTKAEMSAQEQRRLYWLGRSQYLAKQYQACIRTLQTLIQTYPKSSRATKAWMIVAEAHAQQQQFKPSQEIYSTHLQKMLSPTRRLQIARVYLRFAERYEQEAKKKKNERLNYQKAIAMLKHALDLGLPEQEQRKVMLHLGQAYLATQQNWYALQNFAAAVKQFKSGEYADQFVFYWGTSYSRSGNPRKARQIWFDLLKDFPQSSLLPETHQAIAQSYGLPGYASKRHLMLGIDMLQQLIQRFPQHKLAQQAMFDMANTYYRNGRYDEAIKAFQHFLKHYPTTPTQDQTRHQAQARYNTAYCYLRQKHFDQAILAFQQFLQAHPTDQLWPSAQRQIVDARYQKAQEFFRQKQWNAAEQQYLQFLQQYPLDSRNAEIMYQLGELVYAQEKYASAVVNWQQLVSKYPYNYYGRQAQWRIAQTYENKLHNLEKALAAYRKITDWQYRNRAQQAIARLTGKGLKLFTPRIFGVQEGATLEADVRNISSLQVRLYRVDAETYFRRVYSFSGMESLDIQLIRPDQEWTVKVPNYQKLRSFKVKIPIPSKTPMVGVVQVSGGGLEATTVAVVSDLQIFTKFSRQAVFVFALHSQTRQPVAGASLIISDGKKVLWEEKTGKDGSFQIQSTQLREAADVRVLAMYQGSVASTGYSLAGVSYSEGVKPTGFVYTDRPAYRPGDAIAFRGILREVKDGNFQLPTHNYQVEITTPEGLVVYRQDTKTNSWGTLTGTFQSNAAAPLGVYHIRVFRQHGPSFGGSFRLARYQLPKYQLSINLPQRVFRHRQHISGKIIARYGFGAPAANKTVSYQVGPVQGKGTTNLQGELAFRLSTRELELDQTYTLSAWIPGEHATAAMSLWMRSTAFDLGLSTVRTVYAAGESFEVEVKAADPTGQPQAANVRLQWLQRIFTAGQWIERSVGQTDVSVPSTGKASASLLLKQGGNYILRATAQDAWKQTVTATTSLFISGDDDKQILRLLCDRDKFQVGEKTEVRLLARRAGIALITYEAGSVLHYQLLPQLAQGQTILPITFTNTHSPNFNFVVVVSHAQKLYVAKKMFLVQRRLQVALSPSKTTWRPGELAEVKIETKDQSGQPVSAEVALAVVDQALLSIFPDPTSSIEKHFYAYRRQMQMLSLTSHTYSHRAKTAKAAIVLSTVTDQRRTTTALPLGGAANGQRAYRGVRRRPYRYYQRRGYSQQQRRSPVRINRNNIRIWGRRPAPPAQPTPDANKPMDALHLPKESSSQQAVLQELRQKFATTAYWNASIVTDHQGHATIRFKLPDNMTTWKLLARGVSHPTLLGEAHSSLLTKKAFFAELRIPSVVSEGDRVAPKAVVHNQTDQTMTSTLTLESKITGQQVRKVVQVAAHQSQEIHLDELATTGMSGRSLPLLLKAVATAGKSQWTDLVQHTMRVRISGVKVQSGSSGVAREQTTFSLSLPVAGASQHNQLELFLGPVAPAWIIALAENVGGLSWSIPGIVVHQADLTLTALSYLKALGQQETPKARQLLQRLQQHIQTLRLSRQSSEGWNYIGTASDAVFTADVFRVLVQARDQWGVLVEKDMMAQVRTFLKQQYHRSYRDDNKIALLSALVVQPEDEQSELFSYANRLFRKRSQLSLEGLCHLGHTLLALDRKTLAQELLVHLRSKFASIQKARQPWAKSKHGWQVPGVAQAACAVELMAHLAPEATETKQGIEWLLRSRLGFRWSSVLLTRRAVRALATYYRAQNLGSVNLKVSVFVNQRKVSTLTLAKDAGTSRIAVPLEPSALPAKVSLVPEGLGSFQYTATLTGYTTAPKLKLSRFHRIQRHYTPAHRTVGLRIIYPGFSVLRGSYKHWENTVRRLPVGQYTLVKLQVRLQTAHTGNDNLVLEEPLPAGTMVLPSSIYVHPGTYQLEDGRIRFFLYHNQRSWTIQYRLYGTQPGSYFIPPTATWSYARPQRFSVGPDHQLEVVSADATPETYRLTPNELFHLGQAYAQQGQFAQARQLLEQLLSEYTLKHEYLGQVAHSLFKISLKQGPHAAVVKYFELLKEHSPDTILPFEQIMRVGQAYAAAGEFERAYMVYQTTVAARFLKELQVAQALEKEGEFAAAVEFIQTLTQHYPDLRSIQEAYYALAQSVFQHADTCKNDATKRNKWLTLATDLLERFVWLYPTHPSADAASYTRANVLLELGQEVRATNYLRKLAERYPQSGYLADMHYLQAYSLYLQRQGTSALSLLQRVSTQKYPDGKGGLERSKNRHLASFLIAQIYHAVNQLEKALTWYKRVRKHYVDAAAQIAYFERTFLQIPEVQTIAPQQKAAVSVRHQNIRKATVLVYGVDLMKLYLLKKNLNAVTRINLAGIRPAFRGQKVLGQRQEFNLRQSQLDLPLERRGSYLVVLKSRQKEVSGIVLRTALTMDVQEDVVTGQVVVHLFEQNTHKPVAHALVRVIGSSDGRLQSGKTDLRGIFTASHVRGKTTIIAQNQDDFVFFRGTQELQPHVPTPPSPSTGYFRRPAPAKSYRFDSGADMLENIRKKNIDLQQSGRRSLENLYEQSQKGVQLKYFK